MYTNDFHHKKLRSQADSVADASTSSLHLTPLRKSDKLFAAHTSPLRSTPPTARSPLPPVCSPAQSPETEEVNITTPHRTTVMDPLAALRQCLQYVCSRPDIYGDDIRGLLDREVMHVVRLKASEVSLIQGQRPLLVDPLDSTSIRQAGRAFGTPRALPSISASTAAAAPRAPSMGTASAAAGDDWATMGDLFGYGGVSFLPANSAGFSALLRDTRAQTTSSQTKLLTGKGGQGDTVPSPLLAGTQPLDETIQWNGTMPPSFSSGGTGAVAEQANRAATRKEEETHTGAASPFPDYVHAGPYADAQREEDARLFRQVDDVGPSSSFSASRGVLCAADGSAVVLDHNGYEVTYLRTQLQQLEAAFNAKCVRLHELESENRLFAGQMKASEEAAARWSAEHHIMEGKLEALRRELDGWKDRANDALAAATKQSKQRSQHAKQLASNQINDAKQEAVRLSQLWRETERALQESRRAFENTEKEAMAAHNHLGDAFHYLERLERRVARRDAYVQLCERRHRSLEEKYEKLMWGYEELSAVEGRYSYVDYLLSTRPLWSVYLFVLLAQHRGDYVPLEDQGELQRRVARMAAPFTDGTASAESVDGRADIVDPQSWLLFARTPRGGCYAGACFDPTLVLRFMVSEVTAEVVRRGRAKQLRTNLHGSVACRVIRWAERFAIDYLGGQDSFPDSGELNRKVVPLLTLASVILPLRGRGGALQQLEGSATARGTAANTTATTAASVVAPISNTHRYDEATIRFVLRCFWKERLSAFVGQMTTRVAAAEAKRQRQEQRDAARRTSSNSISTIHSGDIEVTPEAEMAGGPGDIAMEAEDVEKDGDEDDAEAEQESGPTIPTFLSALVDFSMRFTKFSGSSSGASLPPGVAGNDGAAGGISSSTSPMPDKATLLRVRGVLALNSSAKVGAASKSAGPPASSLPDAALWDCGRVFFATVLQSSNNPTHGSAAAAKGATTNTSKSPLSESASDVDVAALAVDVRELLAALYYYTLEYKSHDPDFRLFYLVSHQLIPEMVAINFFAGVEGIQRDCAALLERRIQFLAGEEEEESLEELTNLGAAAAATDMPAGVEDPLTALTRTVQLIDDAPLDGQDDEIEPDSDGEGYGSILPFHAKAGGTEGPVAAMRPAPAFPGEARPSGRDSKAHSIQASGSFYRSTQRRTKEMQLLHNIRTYLKERRPSLQDSSEEADGSLVTAPAMEANRLSTFAFGDASSDWTALEEEVKQRLAPHTSLLDSFRALHGPKMKDRGAASFVSVASRSGTITGHGKLSTAGVGKEDRGYLRRKRDDRKTRHEISKCLSATRGLLTTDDILSLLKRHCFATYAVSCCGTPHFSLTDALIKGGTNGAGRAGVSAAAESLQPYSVVGYLPPTGPHLQQLRFALSLDQPSSLVNPANLFTVDPVTKSNAHLYNTYLTLTLDLFQQQQSFLMQSILTSCVGRHEKYAAEGGEDCDGQIPIASLRKGMTNAMTSIQGGAQHAMALVNHFVQYDELLRLEDEVKLEQFADAPLLLNIPGPSPQQPTGLGAFSSAASLKANANNHNVNYRSVDGAVSSARRRSEANNVMEEVEDAEFNLREEAESCSLLHIAFAVRMSYVVWGRLCTDTAAALVARVVQRAVPTSRSQTDDAQAGGTSGSSSQGGQSVKDATQVVELPEWEFFERDVHQRYSHTLERLQEGHNADDNPLRRTLRDQYAQALGRSSVVPYSTEGSSAKNLAQVAAASLNAAAASDAVVITSPPLYPNMTHVFSTRDTPHATSMKADTATGRRASSAEKNRRTEGRVSASFMAGIGSKRSSIAPKPSQQQHEQQQRTVAPLPDYGLISLSRALGFVSPVTAPPASNAGGLGASSKKGASAKKASKKPTGKKGMGAEAGNIPTAVQEEYSRALSTQLQTFASRISGLLQPINSPASAREEGVPVKSVAEVHTNAEEDDAGTAGDDAATPQAVRGVTFPDANAEGSTAPTVAARSRARTRSVAFVQNARGDEHRLGEARRSMTGNTDETARSAANGGRALTWRPVFAEEAREAEARATSADATNALLDVSKLYAACAALSIF